MTDEDKKLIYKFSGWGEAPGLGLISPEGEDYTPPLDINFYFKYPVPKLHAWTIGSCPDGDACAVVVLSNVRREKCMKDPAEAFGQALLKLIKEEK